MAKFIGTVHHEYNFTIQEGLDAIRDVIYHLETYDVTTIRASTPMYLLSRKVNHSGICSLGDPDTKLSVEIRATGVKNVLSGEGADEVFGGFLGRDGQNSVVWLTRCCLSGYLYFHQAPSAEEFHLESLRRVKNLQAKEHGQLVGQARLMLLFGFVFSMQTIFAPTNPPWLGGWSVACQCWTRWEQEARFAPPISLT